MINVAQYYLDLRGNITCYYASQTKSVRKGQEKRERRRGNVSHFNFIFFYIWHLSKLSVKLEHIIMYHLHTFLTLNKPSPQRTVHSLNVYSRRGHSTIQDLMYLQFKIYYCTYSKAKAGTHKLWRRALTSLSSNLKGRPYFQLIEIVRKRRNETEACTPRLRACNAARETQGGKRGDVSRPLRREINGTLCP